MVDSNRRPITRSPPRAGFVVSAPLMTDSHDGKVATLKAATAWGGAGISYYLEKVGFNDWGDVAAFLAACYSLILIGEWVWKKFKGRRARKGRP